MSKKPRKKQPARPVVVPTLEQLEARRVELVKMIERDTRAPRATELWSRSAGAHVTVNLATAEERELVLLDLRIAAMKGKS